MNKISENKINEIIKDLKKYKSLNNKKHKAQYYYQARQNIIDSDYPIELIKEFLDIYSQCKRNVQKTENVETDDRAVTEVERDENGLIQYYTFEIFRKDSPTLRGKLDRKEMETIYKLYSYYGANLTQKIVSREFPSYTFIEFKRILRAFNIYKANSEFAPHQVEELSEEQLVNLHNQNKENNVLRRIEKDQLAEANKLIDKLAKENLELKKNSGEFHFVIDNEVKFRTINKTCSNNTALNLFLSDIHVGACLESSSLYDNPWNEEELERRLDSIINKIEESFGHLDTIVLSLMGDYLDGMDRMTARRDHFMPQNMDNREQFNVFLRRMIDFIDGLSNYCNELIIYAVPEGNHDGSSGYMAIKALQYAINARYPEVQFEVFDRFIGSYEFRTHTYVLTHGKDASFMKKPLPLNLNDSTSALLRDWLDREALYKDNIHIIKGDLHSNNLNSCRKFDYRNVLSIFGDSDYSQMNYVSNPVGVSYDYFIGNTRVLGTFENLLSCENVMVTRNDVLTKIVDECLKELYSFVQPKISWEYFLKENKIYYSFSKEYDNYLRVFEERELFPATWDSIKSQYKLLDWDGNKSKKECIGPCPYEFYYLPRDILKNICDSYIYSYRLDQQQELLDTIEILKNYCKEPIVDKYIDDWTDETGFHHPGYRGYEHPDNLEKEINTYLDLKFPLMDPERAEDAEDFENKLNIASKELQDKFFEFLDMAGNFYKWNRDLNTFTTSIYLGPSPNTNKEAVIENWKKYRNKDIEIDEDQIRKEYYGDDCNTESK